jgi:dienelactone hydrolase
MNSIVRIAALEILLAIFTIIPFSSLAADGVTADNSGQPKGKTPPSEMKSTDWSNPDELKRTWDGAKVRIPFDTGVVKATMINLGQMPKGKKFPVIIYMHGCNGFWAGTDRRVDFLSELNFAVIAPNSFARKKVPTSCEPLKHRGGLYRPTLIMRQYEAAFAIQEARKLAWVDGDNIILMGLSQGGITTATFSGEPVKARIIEGWGCHAGWPEYRGLKAAKKEPVLSLVSEKDPWFQNPVLQGDCGKFMLNDQSESVVFNTGSLRYRHELLEYEEARSIVKAFIKKHTGH